MTNYGKPNRLHARWWLALSLLGGLALNAHAADVPIPKPANGAVSNPNYLEYKKTGNTYTWNPVGTTTPPGSGSVSFPSTSVVSDATPKVVTTGELPYQHKGGAGAKVTISRAIDKAKVAAAAAASLSAAAAAKLKPGSPYVMLADLSCVLLCPFAIEAMVDWGVHQLKANADGSFSAVVPDDSAQIGVSDGREYMGYNGVYYASAGYACASFSSRYSGTLGNNEYQGFSYYLDGNKCFINYQYRTIGATTWRAGWVNDANMFPRASSCVSGSPVTNGVCGGSSPTKEESLHDFIDRKTNVYPDIFWPTYGAVMAASIYQSGKDIFTDGTSIDITGPGLVPIGTTTTSTPINLVPGTTTPAPPGHTGPTDSGTQTSTSTSTATNTFSPGTSGSGSSSGGGSGLSGSGPSMTTGTKTETKTSITNNITNNTSTSVTTHIETKDDAPKEEEKDFCEKNPDALACAEADTPEQDIPRDKVTISYEYADIFGNGACPADSYLNTHGQSLKVWDWQTSCDHIQDYFRPVLIACCAFAAFVIISAGVKE